jgi:predicted DNA binding CopG/RHH family protein
MAKTTLRLPQSLLRQAKYHSADTGLTLQEIMIAALGEYLKSRKKGLH